MPSTVVRTRSPPRPKITGRLLVPPADLRFNPGTSRSKLALSAVVLRAGAILASSTLPAGVGTGSIR